MKIWLPFVDTATGSTTFVHSLANALEGLGQQCVVQPFPHAFQYAPHALLPVSPPPGTDAMITNSWGGFAFHRPRIRSVCVEHLFVFDPALRPYKSFAQGVFHDLFVRHFTTRSYRSSDVVVAVSTYTANQLHSRFPDIDPLIIPNGIDVGLFTPVGRKRNWGDKIPILFAGSPSVRKGADLLAPILRVLPDRYRLCVTANRGDIPELHGAGDVEWLGRLDRAALIDRYRSSALLLSPTRMEGLPLGVMEAMACGLPAVTSDASSLPEIMQGCEGGAMCRLNDVAQMAAAIERLTQDEDVWNIASNAARARIEKDFSFSRTAQAYCDLLHGVEPLRA